MGDVFRCRCKTQDRLSYTSQKNASELRVFVGKWSYLTASTARTYTDVTVIFTMECRRGLAMRILSVRPSAVKRVHCDKTEETL